METMDEPAVLRVVRNRFHAARICGEGRYHFGVRSYGIRARGSFRRQKPAGAGVQQRRRAPADVRKDGVESGYDDAICPGTTVRPGQRSRGPSGSTRPGIHTAGKRCDQNAGRGGGSCFHVRCGNEEGNALLATGERQCSMLAARGPAGDGPGRATKDQRLTVRL